MPLLRPCMVSFLGTTALCGLELGPDQGKTRAGAAAGDVVLGVVTSVPRLVPADPEGSAPGLDAVVLRRRKPAFRQGPGSLIVIIRPRKKTIGQGWLDEATCDPRPAQLPLRELHVHVSILRFWVRN